MRPAVTLLLLLLLAACGAGSDEPDAAAPSTGSSTASSSPSVPPSPTEEPWQTLDGPLGRCGPQPPDLSDTRLRYAVLRDPAVGRIPSVTLGSGRTVAVLLHQTDGNGLCGWLDPATRLVAGAGITALAVDLCQYGDAACRPDRTETDAVAVAVRHAREQLHARRVVLVGASMGGSVALMSAARLDGVDAAVDLSGPVEWPGMEAVRGGRALRVPVLVAMAHDEGPEEVRGARSIAAHAPVGSVFVPAPVGHGYDLVDPLGEQVRDFVAGR